MEVSAGTKRRTCEQSEGAETSVRMAEATEEQMTSRMGLGTIMWVRMWGGVGPRPSMYNE